VAHSGASFIYSRCSARYLIRSKFIAPINLSWSLYPASHFSFNFMDLNFSRVCCKVTVNVLVSGSLHTQKDQGDTDSPSANPMGKGWTGVTLLGLSLAPVFQPPCTT